MRFLIVTWISSVCLLADLAYGDDCSLSGVGSLGAPLVEHSCFHTELGPFTHVRATAGTKPTNATPNINAVHTHYTVELPSGTASVVTYTPARSGTWAAFGNGDTPVAITDDQGTPLPVLLEVPVEDCPAIPIARVVSLEAGQRYLVRFVPTSATSAVVVLEKMADFDTTYGRDDDGDGFGGDREMVSTPCTPPAGFVASTDDCDDRSPQIHPGVSETCDGIDQDCDGVADDEACTLTGAGCAATDASSLVGLCVAVALTLVFAHWRRRASAVSIGLVAFAGIIRQAAAEPCDQLGRTCIDHTCLHARAGPFEAITSTTGVDAPAIDRVHTLYRVDLAASRNQRGGSVTYTPARSGIWALFTDLDVPVVVRNSENTVIPAQRDELNFACSYLARVAQYQLVAGVPYRIEFSDRSWAHMHRWDRLMPSRRYSGVFHRCMAHHLRCDAATTFERTL